MKIGCQFKFGRQLISVTPNEEHRHREVTQLMERRRPAILKIKVNGRGQLSNNPHQRSSHCSFWKISVDAEIGLPACMTTYVSGAHAGQPFQSKE
jgi:hypothetical protein